MYRLFFRTIVSRLDAEHAHELAGRALHAAAASPVGRTALRRVAGSPAPSLAVDVFGSRFPSPLGVAAGLDKNGTWYPGLGLLGFGFVEVGTVTPIGQPGNPRPRVFRIPAERALVNRMGFPNEGAAAVASRLATGSTVPLGVNIGKQKDTAPEDAAADYAAAARVLSPLAAFTVINVSSPNTPGLRALQTAEELTRIATAVRAEIGARPLLVKLAPDLTDNELDALADAAAAAGLDGIVATNTSTDPAALRQPAAWERIGRTGGLSGAPLAPRSLDVLRRLHARVGGRLTLVSAGGVESGRDVWDRIQAGATLVQAYTGFVYGGPLWASRVNRELAGLLAASDYAALTDAVGSSAGT